MGKLLDRAIEEARQLPETGQEAIGVWLLAEINAERNWDELFSLPVSKSLQQLADEALADHRAGSTRGS